MQAFLVTHAESISIADYLSIGPGPAPVYLPTVHYAYHPCDDAVLSLHELVGDHLPHDEILELCQPYLGSVVGAYADWTPLAARSPLYEEDIDAGDPWQSCNFRIT